MKSILNYFKMRKLKRKSDLKLKIEDWQAVLVNLEDYIKTGGHSVITKVPFLCCLITYQYHSGHHTFFYRGANQIIPKVYPELLKYKPEVLWSPGKPFESVWWNTNTEGLEYRRFVVMDIISSLNTQLKEL